MPDPDTRSRRARPPGLRTPCVAPHAIAAARSFPIA